MPIRTSLNVSLTPELEQFVQSRVASGRYQTASEVIREGLRLLEDDTLGGGGSRGSGRVRFANLKLTWRSRDYYASGAPQKELSAGSDLAALQKLVTESAFAFLHE